MKEEIIELIKDKLSEITKLSFEDRHFHLKYYVDAILENIVKLINISDNEEEKQSYKFIWDRLNHTNEKEVEFAKRAYDKAKKKNAAKIRETEYNLSLRKAIRQIDVDLALL